MSYAEPAMRSLLVHERRLHCHVPASPWALVCNVEMKHSLIASKRPSWKKSSKPEDGLLNEPGPGPILREEEPMGLLPSILPGEPGGAPGGPGGGGRPLIRPSFSLFYFRPPAPL